MFVKVYFLDGEILEGETNGLPGKSDSGFYINPFGGSERVWITLNATKKVEIKGSKQVR